jgi:UDP-glucose 4-epimerase
VTHRHSSYRHKRAIVTGGAGFIGSNLAHALCDAGAEVTVIDSLEPGCGGNLDNLAATSRPIHFLHASIGDAARIRPALLHCDVVFNLAGEISHGRSMLEPERDAQLNTIAQLRFLSQLAELRPGVRVVYAGTRQVYGVPRSLPVNEDHPVEPVDFNGIHKYAATMYHMLFSRQGRLDAAVLRLSNVYGPRMALNVPGQGFLGVFFRRALSGERITVYGDGSQLRDPIFAADAIEAFLAAGAVPVLPKRSFNLGGPDAISLGAIAATVAAEAGLPTPIDFIDFPHTQKEYDIGSYVADWTRARTLLGWQPATNFQAGARATLAQLQALRDIRLPAQSNLAVPLEVQ